MFQTQRGSGPKFLVKMLVLLMMFLEGARGLNENYFAPEMTEEMVR